MLRAPALLCFTLRRSTAPKIHSGFFVTRKYSNMDTRIDNVIQYWFGNEEKSIQWKIWFPRGQDQVTVDK